MSQFAQNAAARVAEADFREAAVRVATLAAREGARREAALVAQVIADIREFFRDAVREVDYYEATRVASHAACIARVRIARLEVAAAYTAFLEARASIHAFARIATEARAARVYVRSLAARREFALGFAVAKAAFIEARARYEAACLEFARETARIHAFAALATAASRAAWREEARREEAAALEEAAARGYPSYGA